MPNINLAKSEVEIMVKFSPFQVAAVAQSAERRSRKA